MTEEIRTVIAIVACVLALAIGAAAIAYAFNPDREKRNADIHH